MIKHVVMMDAEPKLSWMCYNLPQWNTDTAVTNI